MDLKQIRIARLRQLQAERGAAGPVELGKIIGCKTNQASDLLNGRASFGEKLARRIEECAGLPMGWLDRRDDSVPSPLSRIEPADLLAVRPLQAPTSADATTPDAALSGNLHLSTSWTRARALDPSTLRYLHLTDDAMEPTLRRADVLLVDTRVRQWEQDGVYVLRTSDHLLVRRIRLRLDGSLEVSADSSTVKTSDIAQAHQLDLVGRVVWAWHGRVL